MSIKLKLNPVVHDYNDSSHTQILVCRRSLQNPLIVMEKTHVIAVQIQMTSIPRQTYCRYSQHMRVNSSKPSAEIVQAFLPMCSLC